MEKTLLLGLRYILLVGLLSLVISSGSVSQVRAQGTLLKGFDVPATVPFDNNAIYWPIGVAFDPNGQVLYYSQPSNITADIFFTTTVGHSVRTVNILNQAGGLAWDGKYLWVAFGANNVNGATCTSGVSGCALLFQVDVGKKIVVKTLDISSIFAADQECNFIDGLDYDYSTGTLWVSPDIGCLSPFVNPCSEGFVYNIDTSGNLLKRIQELFGVAGVARVGNNLYMVTCRFTGTPSRAIVKTDLNGAEISRFFTVSVSGHRESAEALAPDLVTFAPTCALWVVQDYGIPFDASLAAYAIDCP